MVQQFILSLVMLYLVFGLSSSKSSFAAPGQLDRLEASVNTAIILLSDVQSFKKSLSLRTQLDPLFSGTVLASKGTDAPHEEVVEFLIQEKLIAQQFSVSDTDVEQEINSIQANNKIDRSQLRRTLKEQGHSFEDYFELIRSSAAKRNLIDRDIRTKVSISDDDVKNYFFNHYSRTSSVPLAYHLKIITLTLKNYKSSGAAKGVALRALQALNRGESFEEVAKRFSDDPSAPSGGDLGILTEDETSLAIRSQLKKLHLGQVSPLLGGPPSVNYFILKLVDIQSSAGGRFEKMKEEIHNQLVTMEYRHQIALWLERQRQKAFIHKVGESSHFSPASSP